MTSAPTTITASTVRRDWIAAATAGLIGLAFWTLWVDPAILNPAYVDWLIADTDRGVNYFGWKFFRDTPWALPLGINPRYGLELSSSIVYSDSIPLLALPLKLFGNLLPEPFQYFGIWTLACTVLQGVFGYLLARRLGGDMAAALVVSAFCVAAPVMAARLEHLALTAHWTLLAAFFLYFSRTTAMASWPVLLGAVAAIHPYLFVMVFATFCADLAKRHLLKTDGVIRLVVEAILVVLVSAAVMWSIGTFVGASPGSGGFGYFKHDLLGLIDSDLRFSRIIPDIPSGSGAYEGYGFLGVGVILLGLAALPVARKLKRRAATPIWPLGLVVASMFLFSLSNSIDLAGTTIVTLPLPETLENLARILRSSGRFVWPAVYLLTVLCVLVATRHYGRLGTVVATACFALQVFDMAPGLADVKQHVTMPSAPPETISPLWADLAQQYQRVRAIPVQHPGFEWHYASHAAVLHGMSTNSVYLARVPPLEDSQHQAEQALRTGSFDTGAVYILDEAGRDAAAAQARPGDLMIVIDGRFTFARQGCAKLPDLCRAAAAEAELPSL